MADFGSNFTDAFSAVYGARRQAKQQALDNARQEQMDAMTKQSFEWAKTDREIKNRRAEAVKNAAASGAVTGSTVYKVPGAYTTADDALAAYQQKLAAPMNQTQDLNEPAARGVPPQALRGMPPAFNPDIAGAPNQMGVPPVANIPVQQGVVPVPPAPVSALPPTGQPVGQPVPEANAQVPAPNQTVAAQQPMKATQDLFGNWVVAPESEIRQRSDAEVYRAAAANLIRQGDSEGALDLRTKASEFRKLDIEEDHDRFKTAMDGVTKALASGDATQVGAAAKSVLGALNQAKDGVEYRYEPAPDGKGMQLKMYEQSTGMPAPGKPKLFSSIDPQTGLTADMQLVNYLRQFESADAFSNVFKENIAFADRVTDRAAKDATEKRAADLYPVQKRALEANIAQSYAAVDASRASTRLSDSTIAAANAPGALSEKAAGAFNTEFGRVSSEIDKNEPGLKGQQRQDAIDAAMVPWFNTSPYGREAARAIQAQQGGGGGGGGGGATKPPAQPTALPKGPKVVDDTAIGGLSRAVGGALARTGAENLAKSTNQWRQQVNPAIQDFRKEIAGNKVKASTLGKLRLLIKDFPDKVIAANTTEAERKLIGISK